jgi:hypothetical protein
VRSCTTQPASSEPLQVRAPQLGEALEQPLERPVREAIPEALAVERRERPRFAVLEHDLEPRHPVHFLVVGEVPDHVEWAVRALALACAQPGLGEPREPVLEQRRRARQDFDGLADFGRRPGHVLRP